MNAKVVLTTRKPERGEGVNRVIRSAVHPESEIEAIRALVRGTIQAVERDEAPQDFPELEIQKDYVLREANTGVEVPQVDRERVDRIALLRALKRRFKKDEWLREAMNYVKKNRLWEEGENIFRIKDMPWSKKAAALYLLLHVLAEEAIKLTWGVGEARYHRNSQRKLWEVFNQYKEKLTIR